MFYPSGTIVQNYNLNAGRLIQLPCFMDQPEPPDGFRAMIFGTFSLNVDNDNANQNGPDFVGGFPCAVQFDLTQTINAGQLSRLRSISVSLGSDGTNTTAIANLMLNSGMQWPIGGVASNNEQNDSNFTGDFLSDVPLFGIWANDASFTYSGVVVVANFKLSASAFNANSYNAS